VRHDAASSDIVLSSTIEGFFLMASATRLIDGVKAAADDSMVDCIPIGALIGRSLAHGPDFEAADEAATVTQRD